MAESGGEFTEAGTGQIGTAKYAKLRSWPLKKGGGEEVQGSQKYFKGVKEIG